MDELIQRRPAAKVSGMEEIERLPLDTDAIEGRNLNDREVLALVRFPRLVYLDLSGCDRVSGRAIGNISRASEVRYLLLAGCDGVTDITLEELSRLSFLQELDLSLCNLISDQGLLYVALLPNLRLLDLNACYGVGDVGIGALGHCESLEAIRLWSLEGITDAGVASLAHLPRLRRLELPEFSSIGDLGMAELGAHAQALEELRLDNLKHLTDEGLFQLTGCRSLRRLSIAYCPNITAAGIAKLQSALPLAQIAHDHTDTSQ